MIVELIQSNKLDFKKYIKNKKDKYTTSLNFYDIISKLSKNDYFYKKPSEEIINAYLYQKLKRIFNNNYSKLFYVINNNDVNVINNIERIGNQCRDEEIQFVFKRIFKNELNYNKSESIESVINGIQHKIKKYEDIILENDITN